MKSFRSRLGHAMDNKGVTPYKVSKETGVSQSVFSRIKKDDADSVRMQKENLLAVANYLEVEPTWLEHGEGEMSPEEKVNPDSILSERLKKIAGNYRTSIRRFEESIGVSNGYVRNIKGTLGSDVVERILTEYPEVDRNWLITGKGGMLLQEEEEEHRAEYAVQYFPDIPATGSGFENMPEPSWEDLQYTTLYIPPFGGCKAVKVSGDSMYPKLSSGDIVLFSEWNESYVQNGEMYLIITRNGERMFKYLKELPEKEDDERIFECLSANPDQMRYAPFKINGSDIVRLYRVRGRIQEL